MSYSLLSYVCSKEKVGQEENDTTSYLSPKGEGELLTMNGDPIYEGYHMFEEGIYSSVFYF